MSKSGSPKEKEAKEKLPLLRYEPSTKQEPKIWLVGAACLAVCSAVYVAGIVIPSAILVGGSLGLFVISAIVLLVLWRKMRASVKILKESEIDELVERYKEDLVDTFNGYDVNYTADDVLIEADKYRKLLERDNADAEIDDESLVAVLKGAFFKTKEEKERARKEKKLDREQRREEARERRALRKRSREG